MKNEEFPQNDNLQNETQDILPDTEIENIESEEALETVELENGLETDTQDLIGDQWLNADNSEVNISTENSDEDNTIADSIDESLKEEEINVIELLKRNRRKKGIWATVIIAAVVAILAFFICYTEGVGTNNIVSIPLNQTGDAEAEMGFWSKIKTDNIRYENPLVTLFDKVVGRNKDVAITVGGYPIDKGVLNFAANSMGLNTVSYLMQMGMIGDIADFKWSDIEKETGLTYQEMAKGMAVENLVPIFAIAAEGEKHGVTFTEEDDKQIKDWIKEQKNQYGDSFDEILKRSGYEDEDTLYQMQKIQLYTNKVYMDIEDNLSEYITPQIQAKLTDDKVTVKHILIQPEADSDGNITEEAKAAAKKEAESVLAKAKSGESFEKLIEEYNDDLGAADEGYTFAKDGSMVKEFEDASFALEIGEISNLVETNYGYHIIKRFERVTTVDEYIEILHKTVNVNIKKGVFDKMTITVDLQDFLVQQPDSSQEETEATE